MGRHLLAVGSPRIARLTCGMHLVGQKLCGAKPRSRLRAKRASGLCGVGVGRLCTLGTRPACAAPLSSLRKLRWEATRRACCEYTAADPTQLRGIRGHRHWGHGAATISLSGMWKLVANEINRGSWRRPRQTCGRNRSGFVHAMRPQNKTPRRNSAAGVSLRVFGLSACAMNIVPKTFSACQATDQLPMIFSHSATRRTRTTQCSGARQHFHRVRPSC